MWSSIVDYRRPRRVGDALHLLARPDRRSVPLAGGTWLIAQRDPTVEAVVDLRALNLAFVERRGRRLRLGAKAAAEIPIDGVAPAVVNAIYDTVGVRLREIPATPERVWRALRHQVC